jgi:hypothetical protein
MLKVSIALAGVILLSGASCNKSESSPSAGGGNGSATSPAQDSSYHPSDPAAAASQGFFLDAWQARTFNAPQAVAGSVADGAATDSVTIDVNQVITKTPPYVFGANSNLWMGQVVTQANLMQYIKDLSPNIIRGPGGSISDVYFWNQAQAAPADAPAQLPDANGAASQVTYWLGGNTASWTFSLDNYYKLLSQTNSTGIITINYGYARYGTSADPVAAAAHLAADWVRYDKGRTHYWEIGNENYGNWEAGYRINTQDNKDGQPEYITGSVYGRQFKVYADSMRAAASEVGATIHIGAVLYQQPPASYDYASIQTWNQGVLSQAGGTADFFIVHDYFTGYQTNSSVDDILKTGASVPASVMSYVRSQLDAAGVAQKPVALTEWNIQATGSKQNVSYIAGIHAAMVLGAVIKDGFGEASRWDLANGWSNGDDQGMFNSGDEPGIPQWNPRPAFYYMYYFQRCFGDRMVRDSLKAANADLTTYSSTFSSGEAGTIVINQGKLSHVLAIDFRHFPAGSKYYWYTLTGGTDNGEFSGQVYVNGTAPTNATGGPLDYATLKAYSAPLKGTIKIKIPPLSVVYLVAGGK